jgi:hypothetical protein
MDFDEVALNVLLADGVDAPMAIAASYKGKPGDIHPSRSSHRLAFG